MTSSVSSFRAVLLVPAALAALLLSAPQFASATVYTWRDTGSAWATGTNWVGGASPVSSSTNSVLFSGAGGTSNNTITTSNFTQGSIDFGGSAGSYTLTGNSVRIGGITNNSSNTQTLNLALNQANAGTYSANTGKIVIGGALTGAGAITKSGSGELEFTGNRKGNSGALTVDSGTVRFSGGGVGGNVILNNASNLVTSGSFTPTVGVLTANGSGNITIGDGVGFGTLSTSSFDLSSSTGSVDLSVGSASDFDILSASTTGVFGGTLNISMDYTPDNFSNILAGNAWQLFVATTGLSGNFTNVNLTFGGVTYALTNSLLGNANVWATNAPITGLSDRWFLFSTVDDASFTLNGQSVTLAAGTLYAVPEPSTIVFAGIGVAMFGWSTWTRRRAKARQRAIEAAIA